MRADTVLPFIPFALFLSFLANIAVSIAQTLKSDV